MIEQHERDQLRFGLIARMPGLFNPVKRELEEVFDLIRKYTGRKEYEITRWGLQAVYSVAFRYLDVRSGTFFSSALIQSMDYSHDEFLMGKSGVFERLSEISRTAVATKDLEICREVVDCYCQIAAKCTEIRYLVNPLNDYPHCTFAMGYMAQNVEDALRVGMLDLGIEAASKSEAVGAALIHKHSITSLRMIEEGLTRIAMYGVVHEKAAVLFAYPLRTLVSFLRAMFFTGADSVEMVGTLERIRDTILLYLKFKDGPTDVSGVEMQYSIGVILDLTQQSAIPYIFDEAFAKIRSGAREVGERVDLVRQTHELNEKLWLFYDQLAKGAAEKESFSIHFIDSNIEHISYRLIGLLEHGNLGVHERKELLEDLRWYLSIYWRLYDYHKQITKHYHDNILSHLIGAAIMLHRLGERQTVISIIGIIVSIAADFLDKEQEGYGFEPARILQRAVYLCIMDETPEVRSAFVELTKKQLWARYLEKYPEQGTRLFDELLELDPFDIRFNRPIYRPEDKLLASFEKDQIARFVEVVRSELSAT